MDSVNTRHKESVCLPGLKLPNQPVIIRMGPDPEPDNAVR